MNPYIRCFHCNLWLEDIDLVQDYYVCNNEVCREVLSHKATPFKDFPKIPRLKASQGIVITEKIDGTNGVIYVPEDENMPLMFGSRSRWLRAGADNFGFYAWGSANAAVLRDLGPGYHYGEWWGQGIQRRYGLNEKRFSLFNPYRYQQELPYGVTTVPILYQGPFDMEKIELAMQELRDFGSVAAPGFNSPEGIVVYHCASKQQYKYTFDGDKK